MYRRDARQREQYFRPELRQRQQLSPLIYPNSSMYYQFPPQPPYLYNQHPMPQQLNVPQQPSFSQQQSHFMSGPMHYMPQQSFQPQGSMHQIPNQPISANIMQQFQDDEGQIDINKMLSTVGQLANTVQQVSPVIKQVGSLVNSFRS